VFSASGILLATVSVLVLYPLSQIRKNSVLAFDLKGNTEAIFDFYQNNLSSFSDMIDAFTLTIEEGEMSLGARNYFGFHLGPFERFSLIDPADILITKTKIKGFDGYTSILNSLNILPHSITDSKMPTSPGNYLGHKMEILGELDEITSIAITPLAHAWSVDGWFGLILLTFTSFYLIFVSNHIVGNDITRSPWSIPVLIALQHQLAEADVGSNFFYVLRILPFSLALFYCLYYFSKPTERVRERSFVRQ
jgi:hypothetical protein